MNVRVMLMVVCFLGTMPVVFGNQQTLGEDGVQKIRELKEPLLRLLSSSEFAPLADVKKRWSDAKAAIDAFEKDLDVLMAQKTGPKVAVQQAPATVAAVPVVQPKEEVKSATKEEIQKELAGKEKEITEEIKALQPTLKEEEIAEQKAQAPAVEAPVVEKPAEAVSAPAVPVETVPVETVPVETVPVSTVPAAVVPAEVAPVTTVPVVASAPEMPAPAVAPEIVPPAPEQVPVVTPEQPAMPLPETIGSAAVPEGAQ